MSTKDKVLQILMQNSHTPVSGEKLAQECGVSRAAIWKAVNALRMQDHVIEGTTNGGYVLQSSVDIVSEQTVSESLSEAFPGQSFGTVQTFQTIDSTNSHAKRLLIEAGTLRTPDGNLTEAGKAYHRSVFIAESQTAGRGRLGRTFVSPAKTGIYITVVYAPVGGVREPAKLTAFAAVAVKRVIDRLYGVDCSIKWINDLFINGKKVCGILTEGFTNFETGTIESAIVGIGINIADSPEILEKSVSAIAGSITGSDANAVKVSRAKLASQVAGEVLSVFEEDPSILLEQYRKASYLTGKTVQVRPIIADEGSYYDATVVDIDQDACLVVKLEDGSLRHLSSGEVSLHSMANV